GAYQCYGDPFYKFSETKQAHKAYQPEFVIEQEAEIELNNLANELETGRYAGEEYPARLSAISNAVERAGLRNASITQKEALIYMEMGEYDEAINRFTTLLSMEKASFNISTLEKYCNARAKKCVADYLENGKSTQKYISEINSVISDLN